MREVTLALLRFLALLALWPITIGCAIALPVFIVGIIDGNLFYLLTAGGYLGITLPLLEWLEWEGFFSDI